MNPEGKNEAANGPVLDYRGPEPADPEMAGIATRLVCGFVGIVILAVFAAAVCGTWGDIRGFVTVMIFGLPLTILFGAMMVFRVVTGRPLFKSEPADFGLRRRQKRG